MKTSQSLVLRFPGRDIEGMTYVLNQSALVLEGVTLAQVVQLVVEVLVDLAGGTVADEQTTEDTHAAHPEDLAGHTGVLGTLALTQTAVTTDAAGLVELTGAGTRVHGDGLADDKAIADELADGLAGVGVGDLVHLIGVEPNLALAAADHGGGEALLGAKVDPDGRKMSSSAFAHNTLSDRLFPPVFPARWRRVRATRFTARSSRDGDGGEYKTHILMSAYGRWRMKFS